MSKPTPLLMRKNFKILRLGIGEAGATTTGATYIKLLKLQRASEPIQQLLIVLFGKACNEWLHCVVISHPKHTKGENFL
jgi:hypothetical protein